MPQLTAAPHLGDPLPVADPAPTPSCAICVALGKQRETARMWGDLSTVVDCNVEIRRHPHATKRAGK